MWRATNSSSRANTGCTAAAWANTRAGVNECNSVTATADFALLDKKFRRERFISVSPAKAQRRKENHESKNRFASSLRLCAFARETA
jgi:hypothetical protein